MSDFEDLGFDDSELLTVACIPESAQLRPAENLVYLNR